MSEASVEKFLEEVRLAAPHWPPAIAGHPELPRYLEELALYLRMPGHERRVHLHPRLGERQSHTPLDPYYFYQDTWAAERVLQRRPERWVDVGSTALLVGIISRIAPTTSVDVRPLSVTLDGLTCLRGSITELPFPGASVCGLSSLCVIEHVGLGRYGDPVDTEGSLKAFREVARVMAAGGRFLFSVPVGSSPSVAFNAHRIFTKPQVLELLPEFQLVDELFLFPEPGPEERVQSVSEDGFAVWCAEMEKLGV